MTDQKENTSEDGTSDTDQTVSQREATERELEKFICPRLRDVLKWMEVMKMTGNTFTDYEHFKWCCREIILLRRRIETLERIIAA